MLKLTTRRRLLGAAVPLLVGMAALAGCGGDSTSTPASAPLAESSGAAALQQQFLNVVEKVSPQVVQIQTSRGLGSGIVYDDQGDIVTNAHVAGSSQPFWLYCCGGSTRRSLPRRSSSATAHAVSICAYV